MTYRVIPVRRRMFEPPDQVRVPGFGVFSIGRGHSFADLPTVLMVRVRNGKVLRILAADQAATRIAQIWPPYSKTTSFKGKSFRVATAVTAGEDRAARALLRQVHSEGAATHGLLICLYAQSESGEEELAGVAQIGEYYHTRPPGRDAFSRRINGPRFRNLGRGEEIKAVPIVAAKRFAIAAHRQGQGLGRLLGRQTLKVARNYRWPSARVVEVIRYQRARSFHALCCQTSRDFLTRSGYVPVPPAKWTGNGQIIVRNTAISAYQSVAGYYYADVTDADRPGFVARARDQIE